VFIFTIVGYVLLKVGCEPAPLLIAFILGPPMEENLRRSMSLSRGDPSIFLTRPICATILILAALLAVIILIPKLRETREQAFQE
jgi:TctA family transporter